MNREQIKEKLAWFRLLFATITAINLPLVVWILKNTDSMNTQGCSVRKIDLL